PDHFELNSALFVIGYVGQDVILPCQSSSGALPQNVEVQWKKTVDDNTENIYQFTAFTGQETFGQGYDSRAVFATEGLDTGNVSLMLKMAKKSDEGSYSCIVKTKDWGAQTQTVLVVESSKGNSTSENSCSSTAFWVTLVFLLLALLALAVTVWTFKHKGTI
ncbi:CD276 antigen homolog, partial [Lacerta agilis]|uniref:CD276 antigen homolog n=1 Tax=Lacerta agilis TaxID=80427 RepID=UPI00141984D7